MKDSGFLESQNFKKSCGLLMGNPLPSFFFGAKVFLCCSQSSGAHYIAQAGLQLMDNSALDFRVLLQA